MLFYPHALLGLAANIPIPAPNPIISYGPVVIPKLDQPVDLELRVTVPIKGRDLPLIVLSHGHGASNYLSSAEGYAPIAEFLAGHGFVVVQPTHQDSRFFNLTPPAGNEYWYQTRAQDITRVLDELEKIDEAVPTLKGRVDRDKLAVMGHSLGGWTTELLLGTQNTDPRNNETVNFYEKRFKAGVILAGLGNGGDDLSESGKEEIPYHNPDFTTMTTPALVVFGELDQTAHLTIRPNGDWHADPYFESTGPKALLNVTGGLHGLGGVSGWDAGETLDESVERLHMVLRMTWAYLRSQLFEGDSAWEDAVNALNSLPRQLAIVQQKV